MIAAAGIAAAGPAAAAGAPRVRALRTIYSSAFTRLIVECTGSVEYHLRHTGDTLPKILVDLVGAGIAAGGFEPLALSAGPVQSVRAVRTSRGVRVVVAVRRPAGASAFALPDPFRVVVDVAGPDGARMPPKDTPARAGPQHEARGARRQPSPPLRAPTAVQRAKIVIDPGHGGTDPGAVGVGGIREKDVTLAVSARLAARLRATGLFDVVLTRDKDESVALEERTARANAEEADLFVSVHANASPRAELAGVETYYLSNTGDRATIRLAQMENGFAAATGRSARGTEVAWILSDLVQTYKIEESVELARNLQQAVVREVGRKFPGVRDLGVKRGPFYVLVGAAMPSVLVELSFLTHPREGALLRNPAYQEALADGLLQGLRRFVENRDRLRTL